MNHCIGLFGTCGDSKWRDPFIALYNQLHITYFDPQVDNWTSDRAKVEAEHLQEDDVIVFPILDGTYGFGSLAETGYAILQSFQIPERHLLIYVAPTVSEKLTRDNPILAQESNRARKLVIAHLNEVNKRGHRKIHIYDKLEDMLAGSVRAYFSDNK